MSDYINTNTTSDKMDKEIQKIKSNETLSLQYAVYTSKLNDERIEIIISYAIFCIKHGVAKEKVIDKIAEDLHCTKKDAEDFFEKEISGRILE